MGLISSYITKANSIWFKLYIMCTVTSTDLAVSDFAPSQALLQSTLPLILESALTGQSPRHLHFRPSKNGSCFELFFKKRKLIMCAVGMICEWRRAVSHEFLGTCAKPQTIDSGR